MKHRLQFNIALTLFTKKEKPDMVTKFNDKTGIATQYLVKEDEEELEQFYMDLKQFPISDQALNAAFEDLKKITRSHCIKLGLIK